MTYERQVSVPALLEASSWSTASRAYLARHSEFLPISELFNEYTGAIRDLYEWMFAQSEGLDVVEIDAANALIDEYNDVLTVRRR